jgi:hypothetical protein
MTRATTADLERATAQWSASHHAIATYEELRSLGWSDDRIRYRIRTGRWRLLHPGVVQLGTGPLTRKGMWSSAVRAGGPGAFLTGMAAAELWGLLRHRSRRIDVVTAGNPRRAAEGVHVHRTRWVLDKDRRVRDGIPVASPIRLAVDLAELADPYELVGVLHQLERRRMLDRRRLASVSRRLRNRHHGAAAMVFALEHLRSGSTGPRGLGELVMARAIRDAGLPPPLMNVLLRTKRGRMLLDLWWPGFGCALEVDDPGHDAGTMRMRDETRDEILDELGIPHARVTNGEVVHEMDTCLGRVRELLRRGGWCGAA